jgi:tetratricopeptide (TPR) repeat protein
MLRGLGKYSDAAQLQRQAISSIEKLVAEDPADRELYVHLAEAYSALGTCLNAVKDFPRAAELFRRSIEMFEKLTIEFPDRPKLRLALAHAVLQLGTDFGNTQNWAGAEPHFRRALSIYDKLAAESPKDSEVREFQTGARSFLGVALKLQGKKSEAIEQQLAVLKIWEASLAESPDSVKSYTYVVSIRKELVGLLMQMGKLREAEEEQQRGLALLEKRAAVAKTLQVQVDLAAAYDVFAEILVRTDRPDDGLQWIEKAIRMQTGVYEKNPRFIAAKRALAKSYQTRAKADDALKRYAEAVKDWDRSLDLNPQKDARVWRANAYLQAGQVKQALSEVNELSKQDEWSAAGWFEFARIYSVAAVKDADKKKEHADRAMEFLSKAVKAGYTNPQELAVHADLEPLRDRDDFKTLMESLKKK